MLPNRKVPSTGIEEIDLVLATFIAANPQLLTDFKIQKFNSPDVIYDPNGSIHTNGNLAMNLKGKKTGKKMKFFMGINEKGHIQSYKLNNNHVSFAQLLLSLAIIFQLSQRCKPDSHLNNHNNPEPPSASPLLAH